MAGLGFKTFVNDDVLGASELNGYLMQQTVMVFTSTTARDAAITAPTEGMTCYLADTNVLQSYNGAAWVTLVDSDTPPALQLVKVQTFSGATNVDVTNCFTSEFINYRVLVRIKGAATNAAYIRLLVGSTVQTNALYSVRYGVQYSVGTMSISTRGDQYSLFGDVGATYYSDYAMEFGSPQAASQTNIATSGVFQRSATDHDTVNVFSRNSVSTQIDGVQLTTAGGTNIDGTVTVYGYRSA